MNTLASLLARHTGWLIFLLAFLLRLVYIFGRQTYMSIEEAELVQVARTLADSGDFASPFRFDTGFTAHVAPVYPFLLSLVYRVFGHAAQGQVIQEVLYSCISSGQFALLPSVASAGGLRRWTGIAAGLLGAMLPLRLWMETKGSWESALVGLLFLIASRETLALWKRPAPTWQRAIGLGLLWGLALLAGPALVLVFAAMLAVWAVARRSGDGRIGARAVLTAICGVAIVVLPWIVRNHVRLGGVFWVRSNLGLELAVSNNRLAAPTQAGNAAEWGRIPHPFSSDSERRRVVELGELAYNRVKLSEALDWIRHNPGRFAGLTAVRALRFWFPAANRPSQNYAYWGLVLAAILGLYRAWRLRTAIAVWVAIAWACYPLMYYFIQADPRYPYPLHWTFLLMAACAFWPGRRSPSDEMTSAR